MSNYEDYNRISRSYDRTRRPVGVEIVLDCLALGGAPLDTLKLLDAGCGTGAYAAALGGHVGDIVALDFSEGMLGAARQKCRELPVGYLRGSIDALPLAGAAVDGIVNNLVLHHLPDDEAAGFPTHRRVIGEFARVLRPGGVLVIGRTTRDQLRDGYWFSALIPRAIAACSRVTIPVGTLAAMLTDCGFRVCEPAVPFDETIQGDAYFDRLGPLDPAWRDGDSVWTLAPAAELESAIARVRDMEAAGTMAAFMAEHDASRAAAGQVTYICAIKR